MLRFANLSQNVSVSADRLAVLPADRVQGLGGQRDVRASRVYRQPYLHQIHPSPLQEI
jgi:hypothetical protein